LNIKIHFLNKIEMDMQELTRELKENYEWNHDIEWGWYKFAYFNPDGTQV